METFSSEEDDRQKPFKLCFAEKSILGRSKILPNKPIHLPHIVPPKLYEREKDKVNQELVNKFLQKLKVIGPREKYRHPMSENEKYGWYQIQTADVDKLDRRLNFHKRTDIVVKEHLMNYAKIRE